MEQAREVAVIAGNNPHLRRCFVMLKCVGQVNRLRDESRDQQAATLPRTCQRGASRFRLSHSAAASRKSPR